MHIEIVRTKSEDYLHYIIRVTADEREEAFTALEKEVKYRTYGCIPTYKMKPQVTGELGRFIGRARFSIKDNKS